MKNLLSGKDIVGKYKIWFIIPSAIILIALIVFGGFAIAGKSFSSGMNVGIDFAGGSELTIQLGNEVESNYNEHVKKIEDIIKNNGGKVTYKQSTGEGSSAAIVLKFNVLDQEVNDKIKEDVRALYNKVGDDNFVNLKFISSSSSTKLLSSALISVLISTILILFYVAIRFNKLGGFTAGSSAIIALMHDVILMIALTTIFHIQINTAFVAALITIVAYSINDTIVIFDRIRENYDDARKISSTVILDHTKLVNKAVSSTFLRSFNTSITTLFSIVMLAIIGVASIKEFALPVIFGLVMGTYSSMFISPSCYVLFKKAEDINKEKKKAKMTAKKLAEKK